MKIGVFGGTFNPIHTGHAMIANYASQWLDLDEVWLMVSPVNPLKEGRECASEADRIAMAQLVAGRCVGVKVSDFEFSLPRPSYTYLTLSALKREYPEHEFALIIGSDNWLLFDKWREYERIIAEFPIWIYPRPGYEVDEAGLPATVHVMSEAPQALMSSTMVRDGVKKGKNLNFFIPPEVFDYITTKNLYR